MMSNEIIVPILSKDLDYGGIINYDKLKHKWFEQIDFDNNNNFINKALILDIKYAPDDIYCKTEGKWGTCWIAEILDSGDESSYHTNYHFRNLMDLIKIYNSKGYILVNEY